MYVVTDGLKHGAAATQERTHNLWRDVARDLEHKSLFHSHDLREATSMFVVRVLSVSSCRLAQIGSLETILTEVFLSFETGGAHRARISNPGDSNLVSHLELPGGISNPSHESNAFVSQNQRIVRHSPIVLTHVHVGVAHATMRHVDLHLRRFQRWQLNVLQLELATFLIAHVGLYAQGSVGFSHDVCAFSPLLLRRRSCFVRIQSNARACTSNATSAATREK
mmetsp:Transcript_11245/g.69451  ORF Transcript_11245/g.69451 Transcript_11245/m.69451 type:complete len:223 (-) Transcript_11245:104-772(-)